MRTCVQNTEDIAGPGLMKVACFAISGLGAFPEWRFKFSWREGFSAKWWTEGTHKLSKVYDSIHYSVVN